MSGEAGSDGAIINRLLAFSDGTFAIALTLLVLELRPPPMESQAAFATGMQALAPKFAAYMSTFAVVSVFWLAHMSYMRRLVVFDWAVTVVNLLLLFFIALTPFASAMLGDLGVRYGWAVYGGVMIGASAAQTLVWLVASRGKGRLLGGGVSWKERAFRTVRAMSPGLAFGAGWGAAVTGYGEFVVWSPLLIIPIMVLAGLVFGFRHHPTPAPS